MRRILLLFCVAFFTACGAKQQPKVTAIIILEVPNKGDVAWKSAWIAEHYWDNMPFADTAYIDKEVTLQAFSDYAYILKNISPEVAKSSVSRTMDLAKVNSDMYAYFAQMAFDHFFKPNSPYRSDDIYIGVLENMIAWDGLDELHKISPRSDLALVMRNRVGERAEDFEIPVWKKRLYEIKNEYVLLYFATHNCPICAILEDELDASELVQRMIQSGKMGVIKIYPEDMNPGEAGLYDLRARPSMYLLDRDKTVLLKDASAAAQIEQYFERE